jgi:A/G-specific adenine glycosylase
MAREEAGIDAIKSSKFRRGLLRWFGRHQRKLPWRGERDPYRILVSEIMLQQTRVAVVEERYVRFIAQFPTANKLASAGEPDVLTAWSGLGYYRRARNLRRAAQAIVRRRRFPADAAALRELPGIGRYTANAVASIAFGEPVPVVDGNVKRVLERVFAGSFPSGGKIVEERYWQLAEQLLERRSPGDFNQAMMELGALVCLPRQPLCVQCPVAAMCAARGPVGTRPRQARRRAVLSYALVRREERVLLQQRPPKSSLMPGMWELPALERPNGHTPLFNLRHSITTTDYVVQVFAVERARTRKGKWVPIEAAQELPLTGLAQKILRRIVKNGVNTI